MSLLKRVQAGRDPFAQEALTKLDKRFGTTFNDNLKDSYTKAAFGKDSTAGSRKAVLGGDIGAMATGFAGQQAERVGRAAGAFLGAQADKFGGRAMKGALDLERSLQNSDFVREMGRYGTMLKAAAERGGDSLAVTNFLLQQHEPEYRKKLQEMESGNP